MSETSGYRVMCRHCVNVKLIDIAACLNAGWPSCHGETMELIDPPRSGEWREAVKHVLPAWEKARKR